ncbi:MAG: O-antigen ligase family protein [Desulfobacterales bacterium]
MPEYKLVNIIDKAIEKGVIFLLIFTPLAFGTVQQWSVAVLEITAFSLFFLLLLKKVFELSRVSDSRHPLKCLSILFICLAGIILFQMLPLPEALLQIISPTALATHRNFGNHATGAFHTVSINPYATRQELFKLLAYAAVFVVVVSHYKTKAQVDALVKAILYMACFLVVFAVLQTVTWNGRIFWIYPVDETLRSGRGIWGPYINRNHFAGYMEMAIPLGMGLLLYWASHVKTFPGDTVSRKIARFMAGDTLVPFTLLFLFLLFMAASIFMTFSRGGIIGFAVSSLFFAWMTHIRKTLRNRKSLIALLAAVIFAAVVLAAWDRIEKRFADLEQDYVSRYDVLEDSLGIIRDYPLLGTGFGTFLDSYMQYQTKMPLMIFDHAHNDYLETATDTGVIGALLAAGMVLVFFIPVFRRWRKKHGMFGKCMGAGGLASCASIAVHSFTDFNLRIPANALLLAVISAATYAAVFNVSDLRGDDAKATHHGLAEGRVSELYPRKPLRVSFLFLLALILLSFPVTDLAADYCYGRVAGILDDETTEALDVKPISESAMPSYIKAIGSLKKAAVFAPSRSAYQKALSEIYARLGTWSETMESLRAPLPANAIPTREAFEAAVKYLEKAVSLEPTNPDYHLALGQLYDRAGGDARLADRELKRAAEAYPVNAPLRYALAMHYLLSGRKGDALEQARVLARIDDSYIIHESELKAEIMERQTPGYLSWLSRSYLYSALEIAWRVSKDPEVVKGIAPDIPDAARVVQLFMEIRATQK